MKALDWIVNAALLIVAAALVAGGPPSGRSAGDDPETKALRGRVEGIEARLRGEKAGSLGRKLATLEEGAGWLEKSLEEVQIPAGEPASEPGLSGPEAGEPRASGAGDADALALQAIERARVAVAPLVERLGLEPDYEARLLGVYAEHELRVLTGFVRDMEDFPAMFREMKGFLDGEKLKVLLTEFGPGDPSAGGGGGGDAGGGR